MDTLPTTTRGKVGVVLGLLFSIAVPAVAAQYSLAAAAYTVAAGAAAALAWFFLHGLGPAPQEIISEPPQLALPGTAPTPALRPGPEPPRLSDVAMKAARSGPYARVSAGLTACSGLAFLVSIGAALGESPGFETAAVWAAGTLLGCAVAVGTVALVLFALESRRMARWDD